MKKNSFIIPMMFLIVLNKNSSANVNMDAYYKPISKEAQDKAYDNSNWFVGVEQTTGVGDFSLFGDKFNQPLSEFINTDLTQTRVSFGRRSGPNQVSHGSEAAFYIGKGVESTSVGIDFKATSDLIFGESSLGTDTIKLYFSGHFGLGWFEDKGTEKHISTNISPMDYILKSDEQIIAGIAPDIAYMRDTTKYSEIGSGIGVMFLPSDNFSFTAGYELNARSYTLTYGLESAGSTPTNDKYGVFGTPFEKLHSFRIGFHYAF